MVNCNYKWISIYTDNLADVVSHTYQLVYNIIQVELKLNFQVDTQME
jgi:hypothetical protein